MDMRVCTDCGENVDINENAIQRTWQQWKCYACGQWNDRDRSDDRRLENLKGDEVPLAQPGKPIPDSVMTGTQWDLCDADGDYHEPVWYLDYWLIAREEYSVMLSRDIGGMDEDEQEAHMVTLDSLLEDLDKAETYVNRLFSRT